MVLTRRKRESADAAAATLSSDRAAGYAAHATDEEAAACIAFAIGANWGVDQALPGFRRAPDYQRSF